MTLKPSRRVLLKSLGLGAGAGLLGPLYRQLVSDAWGQVVTRKRLVVIAWGNGLLVDHYRPSGNTGETTFTLPAGMTPLASLRDRMLLLEQFYNPHNKDLHGNGWATLSVRPSPQQSTGSSEGGGDYGRPSGISLDRYIASRVGGGYSFPSITLALPARTLNLQDHLSSDGPDAAFPARLNPVQAFDDIFRNFTGSTSTTVDKATQLDTSILDAIRTDVTKLNAALAPPERAKLDQYLTSLSELENRLKSSAGTASDIPAICGNRTRPPSTAVDSPSTAGSVNRGAIEAMFDLMFNALVCQRTSVGHISVWANAASQRAWSFLGYGCLHEAGMHANNQTFILAATRYHFEQIARFCTRLAQVPEGGGTMLDNTLVMVVNSAGGSHHNGHRTHSVTLIGNVAYRLRTGRYLKFSGRAISDAYVSVANAFGIATNTFGDPAICAGPLPGLT